MTDGQWLWLFVNQAIDNDEFLDKMCPECRNEVTSKKKCVKCGKVLADEDKFINPNFDASRFDRLSNDGIEYSDDIDIELIRQASEGGVDIGT